MRTFAKNVLANWNRAGRVFEESGLLGGGLRIAARVSGGRVRRHINAAPRLYHLTGSRTAALIAGNDRFRDKHLGRTAYVVATGPSLAAQDLSELRNGIVIGVNENFAYLPSRGVAVAYSVAQDDDYFDRAIYRGFWRDLGEAARASGMTPVIPSHAVGAIAADPAWSEVAPAYSLLVGEFLAVEDAVALDFTAPVPAFLTTTHTAIAWAIFLGCAEIKVLGVDLDHVENLNVPMRHCYGHNPYNDHDQSSARRAFRLNSRVPSFDLQAQSFDRLADIARRRSQRIVDAGLRGRAGNLPKEPLPMLDASAALPALREG